jgi:alcohol dehydrogenase class IV
LIAIPTTYAGSEMTPVFGVSEAGRKNVQRNPAALARVAIYDPELTIDLSPELTATTAMNALGHCVEACYARDVNPIVPPVALEGIRHIVRALPIAVAQGTDIDSREELMRGAYLAAFSIANATMGLHHGLCHVLGGRTGAAHGALNAIVLTHVMRFNAPAVPSAMTRIAEAMDAGARTRDIEAAPRFVAALLGSLPVKKRLRDVGVPSEALDSIAAEAAENSTVRANPRPASQTEIRQLLQQGW